MTIPMRSFLRPTLLAAGMVLFVLPVLAQTPPPPPAPPAPPPQTASPTPPAPGTFGGQNQAAPANLPWMNPGARSRPARRHGAGGHDAG